MVSWDERFRTGEYPTEPEPAALLAENIDWFPDGRALDVAAGTGRNAVFLAESGYQVDAIDQSRAGLRIARENAFERGTSINGIQADAHEFEYPTERYDVISISFFRTLDRLGDIKEALKPGGVLYYQHHLRTTDAVEIGPSTDRYRFQANEMLHACLDLTVLRYQEFTEDVDGRTAANVAIIARNTRGPRQSYPPLAGRGS